MLLLALSTLLAAVALPTIYATPTLLMRTTSLTFLASATLAANVLCPASLGPGASIFSGLLCSTTISLAAVVLVCIGGAIATVPWGPLSFAGATPAALTTVLPTIGTYPLFLLFTVAGANTLVASSDLITLYLAIELQSFAVYILAALYRDSETATNAGLLYFLLGGLSSSLILLGSALVYAYTGHTHIQSALSMLYLEEGSTTLTGIGPIGVGLTILSAGFLFKVTAAPFHNWGPDVYDGVPTIVTTWLAVLPKVSILALLLSLQSGFETAGWSTAYDLWANLFLVCALLSLLVGSLLGLTQIRMKRLLAYSTVSHVGFMLLALAVHSESSVEAYVFYLAQYTFTSLNAFLVLLAIGYAVNNEPLGTQTDMSYIPDIFGSFALYPLLGVSIGACMFSMAGVPPLVGFFGKQAVLYTAVQSGYYFIAIVAVVVSVVSASYYLYIVRVVVIESPWPEQSWDVAAAEAVGAPVAITSLHSYIIALLTLGLLFFYAFSGTILDSTSLLALSLYTS